MMIQRLSNFLKKKNCRRGSVTIELVFLVPMFVFMMVLVWQIAVGGMAALQTHSAMQDAMRIVSVTGDEQEAYEEGVKAFGQHDNYRLENSDDFKVTINGDRAYVDAATTVDFLFIDKSFTFERDSVVKVINDSQ